MSTATPPLRPPYPRPRRWTKAEYYEMGRLGWFDDQRVEFLDGEILEMPNPGPDHAMANDNTTEVLKTHFRPDRFWVRMQHALDLGADLLPAPDVAVVPGPKKKYAGPPAFHPQSAVLVAEMSDSTLSIDRRRKGSMYASVQIPEYWVLNLQNRTLEVYRQPVEDPATPYGWRYALLTTLTDTDTVSPLAAPQAVIAVADLLP